MVTSALNIKPTDPDKLFLHLLPKVTKAAFLLCTKLPLFLQTKWYLAGGTALALQVGHRQSVDLDFFTPEKAFTEISVERELFNTGMWQTTLLEKGTIFGTLRNAKISFIAYPFFIPSKHRLGCGMVRILLSHDIASMKVIAISQRGRKRDFVDLYWYCINQEPLTKIIQRAVKQYPGQEYNIAHILKSLTYFSDADGDLMPKVFFKTDWRTIRKFFQQEVKKIARVLVGL